MTEPRTESIRVTRGDDYGATFTFDQPVASFAEMRFTIREDWASAETDNADASLTTTLVGSGTYTADLQLSHADTLTLTLASGQYVYDVQITTASGGKIYTTQRGMLRVTPDATR